MRLSRGIPTSAIGEVRSGIRAGLSHDPGRMNGQRRRITPANALIEACRSAPLRTATTATT